MYDIVASEDQLGAEVSSIARVTGEYFKHLQTAGFSDTQAFELCKDYHNAFWRTINQDRLDDDGGLDGKYWPET